MNRSLARTHGMPTAREHNGYRPPLSSVAATAPAAATESAARILEVPVGDGPSLPAMDY
jgi:hypothetical protein